MQMDRIGDRLTNLPDSHGLLVFRKTKNDTDIELGIINEGTVRDSCGPLWRIIASHTAAGSLRYDLFNESENRMVHLLIYGYTRDAIFDSISFADFKRATNNNIVRFN
jgi:hypothetical protein